MSNNYNNATFGDINASLNYDPTQARHRNQSAVYIRPTPLRSLPNALDLADAKELHAHLGKLIDQIEAGIEAQKPKLPTAFGSVVEIADRTWVRLEYGWWTDGTSEDIVSSDALQREDFTVLRDGI